MSVLEDSTLEETCKAVLNEMGESIELGRDIMKRLGPDGSLIFLKYEMLVSLAYSNTIEKAIKKIYQKGLIDGKLSVLAEM